MVQPNGLSLDDPFHENSSALLSSTGTSLRTILLSALYNFSPDKSLSYLTEPQLEAVIAAAFGSLLARLTPDAAQGIEKQMADEILLATGTLGSTEGVSTRAAILIGVDLALGKIADEIFVNPTSQVMTRDYNPTIGVIDKFSDQVIVNSALAELDVFVMTGHPLPLRGAVAAGVVVTTINDLFEYLVVPTPVE